MTNHNRHGLRIDLESIELAVSSLLIRSVTGLKRSLRPNSIEITPKCPTLAERCAVSHGVIVWHWLLMQSRKFCI